MKTIKAYYSEKDKFYTDKEVYRLTQAGYEVEQINSASLPRAMLTPQFVIYKNNQVFNKLVGKQNPGAVVSWVKNTIKDNE